MLTKTIFSTLTLGILGVSAAPAIIKHKRGLSFDYANEKVRGVNLGGWFVLEPWITPSLFQEWASSNTVVDEYTYCQTLGQSEAQSRLSNHWNTWITQDDFNGIAAAGLNHVRIPIGYWAVAPQSGDPYVQGQVNVLDQAIGWARSAGLKVLLDVHGVPGSQNGFDNSGRKGAINWSQQDPSNHLAKSAVTALAQRYASQSDVVTSIECVNEPANWGLDMNYVKQYYYDSFGTIRDSNPDTAIVIHDAFETPDTYWNGFFASGSGINNAILDTHQYQIFSDGEVSRSPSDHVQYACHTVGPMLGRTDKWTIVGEWTGAQTDCAQWLNGLGMGARYDGTFNDGKTQQIVYGSCDGKYQGTVAGLSAADKQNIRSFIEAQLDAYETKTGWIFWTWKAESAPEWHMKDLLAGGLFPQPLTDRQFPGQCN